MEAEQQSLRLEIERLQLRCDVHAQCVDIKRVVVISRQRPKRRLPAHPRQGAEHRVIRRRRRRSAILRIKRRCEDPGAALADHHLHRRSDSRMAVAHRIMDADLRQVGPQRFRNVTLQ